MPGMASDDEPAFLALTDRLEHTSWRRPLTSNERTAFFRRAVARISSTRSRTDHVPTDEEVEARGLFLAYRLVRWLLQGLGWGGPAEPMSFVTEVQGHRQGAPFARQGMWHQPIPKQVLAPASSTLPGLYELQLELDRASSDGLFIQPPDPTTASESDQIAFTRSLVVGIEALELAARTVDQQALGLPCVDIREHLHPRRFFTEDAYAALRARFPTPQQLLDFEQTFMTALAETLAEVSEDRLRMWIRDTWKMVDFEAFSLTQTAKAWAAAMRPIDMEVERRNALRRLEASLERARIVGDHRGEIMAQVQISRILGLAQQAPIDADGAAAQAALGAHDEERALIEEAASRPADSSSGSDSVAFERPSLEDWAAKNGHSPFKSTGFDALTGSPSVLDPGPSTPTPDTADTPST